MAAMPKGNGNEKKRKADHTSARGDTGVIRAYSTVEELSSITRTAEDFPTVSPPETKQSHPGNGHPVAIEDPASRRLLPHQRWSPHLASKQPPPLQTSPPSPLLDLTICISKVRPAFANYELISETPIASAAVP